MAFDPVSAISGITGFGLSIAGAYESYEGAKQQSNTQQNMIAIQQQQDQIRQQQMEMQASRMSIQTVRQAQQARALATTNATNQGASYGSGLSAGLGGIRGEETSNLQGINQGLYFGEKMFQENALLSQQKIAYAKEGTQVALGQGLSSIGSSLTGGAQQYGNLSQFLMPKS